eukprot:TRINITY_DN8003_c0_g1_i1.p1 TRINITY_DN8003_c0_g1~~TRINITY_DN8003_c0_g1_i1.p1  ORF type:complete len:174 (+),score=50.97 TRINITY_DN8003_c0_g1_i1:75-596(+)
MSQLAFQRGLGSVRFIKKGFDMVNMERLDQIETAAVRIQLFNERAREVKGEWEAAKAAGERQRLEAIFWEIKGKAYVTYNIKQEAITEFLETEPLVRQVVARLAESYSDKPHMIPAATKMQMLFNAFEFLPEDEKHILIQNEYPDPISSAEGFMSLKERYDVVPEPIQLKALY